MNKSDRDIIISIVTRAFEENPRAQAMMKKKDPTRSVRLMPEYAYDLIEKFEGIYLSEDKTTVLFYYRNSQYRRRLVDLFRTGKCLPWPSGLPSSLSPFAGKDTSRA